MQCPKHSQAEVIGYCSVCGAFGCSECLTAHEGTLYCPRHYQPFAQKLQEEKRHAELRKKHPRQFLAAHYNDGHCQLGVCFALNLRDSGFHLNLVDSSGAPLEKTELVRFQDLKAVYLLKSLDGRFNKAVRYKEWAPEGAELVVKFKDGEVVRGFSLRRYDPDEPRFHLIPLDPNTNNMSILVERAAVEGVYTPEEYKAKLAQEREAVKQGQGATPPIQEETLGDFYFETRNYESALEQYRQAQAKFPQFPRLRKKWALAQYNVGVQYIKRREYDKALACMELVLKVDPRNPHALKKVSQLRHVIKKEGIGPRTQS